MDSTVAAALIGVGGVVLTIAGTLGGTYLGTVLNHASAVKTARELQDLERHKYTQDRLWDARKEAYSAIIAGLRKTEKASRLVDEGFNSGEADPEEYFHSDVSTKQIHILWSHWQETQTEYDNARLLVSDEFIAAFEKLHVELDALDEDDIPPLLYRKVANVFTEALPDILATAKNEIVPTRPA